MCNGVQARTLEDAIGCADMLVTLDRAISPHHYLNSWADHQNAKSLESMY